MKVECLYKTKSKRFYLQGPSGHNYTFNEGMEVRPRTVEDDEAFYTRTKEGGANSPDLILVRRDVETGEEVSYEEEVSSSGAYDNLPVAPVPKKSQRYVQATKSEHQKAAELAIERRKDSEKFIVRVEKQHLTDEALSGTISDIETAIRLFLTTVFGSETYEVSPKRALTSVRAYIEKDPKGRTTLDDRAEAIVSEYFSSGKDSDDAAEEAVEDSLEE